MIDSKQSDPEENRQQILFDGLNEHGFLFQEKCADILRKEQSYTKWKVQRTEYPVSTGLRDTRIDILIEDTANTNVDMQIYAIIECKRVNCTRGYWLFGKPVDMSSRETFLLSLQGRKAHDEYSVHYSIGKRTLDIHSIAVDNWWLEITRQENRKKYNSSPQPIENTLIQACVGVSGMA